MAPGILPNRVSGLPGLSKPLLAHSCGQPGAQEAPRSDFGRFWNDFGTPEPWKKQVLHCLQKTWYSRFSLKAFRKNKQSSQNDPKSVPRPRRAPGEAQEPPGAAPKSFQTRFDSRRAPRAPRERPRSRQEAPQNRSKRAFAAGEPQERPGEAQGPPQRAILEPPGLHLGAFWEPPGLHF